MEFPPGGIVNLNNDSSSRKRSVGSDVEEVIQLDRDLHLTKTFNQIKWRTPQPHGEERLIVGKSPAFPGADSNKHHKTSATATTPPEGLHLQRQ